MTSQRNRQAINNVETAAATETKESPAAQLIDELNQQLGLEPENFILCASCRSPITNIERRIEIQHSHHHHFTNPDDIAFDIACFSEALGCIIFGEPSLEFTWFQGYQWQYAICAECNEHLGWYYQASHNNYFYGLILKKLRAAH